MQTLWKMKQKLFGEHEQALLKIKSNDCVCAFYVSQISVFESLTMYIERNCFLHKDSFKMSIKIALRVPSWTKMEFDIPFLPQKYFWV